MRIQRARERQSSIFLWEMRKILLPNDILTVPRGAKTTNECRWQEKEQQQKHRRKYIKHGKKLREVDRNCTANNRPKRKMYEM